MNKVLKSIILAAVAVAGVTSAQAQYTANDLLLGITTPTAQNDLVINLGNANTSVGANGSLGSVVNLSSLVTASDLTSFGSSFEMGVVGGQPLTSGRDLYVTQLRSSLGTPSVAGSVGPSPISSSTMGNGIGDFGVVDNNLGLTGGQKATISRTDPNSWSTLVAPGTGSAGQFINDTGINPMGTASGSLIYEDLYRATPTKAFQYLGYFTLDDTGASPLLTFTAIPVPEPSTYGVIAAAGLLVLSLGRQFSRRLQA